MNALATAKKPTAREVTAEARRHRESIRQVCVSEAIRSSGMVSDHGSILKAAKAFEDFITTGKVKSK